MPIDDHIYVFQAYIARQPVTGADTMPYPATTNRLAIIFWVITALFLCRVLGQAGVYFLGIDWLPPFDHWYSGLLAYRYLLPAQCLILLLMVKINIDVHRQSGYFHKPHIRTANGIRWFSYIYAGGMVIRYAVTMHLYPDRRWLGEGTIPIAFHLILALYLYLYSTRSNRDKNGHV